MGMANPNNVDRSRILTPCSLSIIPRVPPAVRKDLHSPILSAHRHGTSTTAGLMWKRVATMATIITSIASRMQVAHLGKLIIVVQRLIELHLGHGYTRMLPRAHACDLRTPLPTERVRSHRDPTKSHEIPRNPTKSHETRVHPHAHPAYIPRASRVHPCAREIQIRSPRTPTPPL